MRFYKIFFIVLYFVLFLSTESYAAQNIPSIQERRAMQEAEAMKMKKQQEVAIYKRQRDELLANYKALVQSKNQLHNQRQVAQKDYKTAMAKFNQARQEEAQIQVQVSQLRKNKAKLDGAAIDRQIQKLRETQSKLIEDMKIFSKVQQESYQMMLAYDDQYRNVAAKEQVLRLQVENIQRQMQFVISQP